MIIHYVIFEGRRIGEAAHTGPRLRRRGLRSLDSQEGRRNRGGPPRDATVSEVESRETGMTMLLLNLRSYISHIAETTALLRAMEEQPFLVCLNETFLNKAMEHVELEGYEVLARRDRQGQWGGGILVFVLDEYFARVTLVAESASAERICLIAHSDQGPYLVCCWYRPPNPGNIETIESLETEYNRYKEGAVGVFVLGDFKCAFNTVAQARRARKY